MSKAGKQLIEAAKEALAVARGEQPAAAIWVKGHKYVPDKPQEKENGLPTVTDST